MSGADAPCPASVSLLPRKGLLKNVARLVREKRSVTILAMGSSSTEGIGATAPARTYPAQLEGELKRQFKMGDIRVVNAGIGGETADASLTRLETRLKTEHFDLVVWQVGTNDAVKGEDEVRFRALLERGLRAAREANVELVFMDQQFYPTIKDPLRYERFVQQIKTVADENGTPVLSRYSLMKNWAERAPQDLPTMLSGDGFHMSDRGYRCLAQSMSRAMGELVDDPASRAIAAKPADVPATQVSLSRH